MVKILDFGLAKVDEVPSPASSPEATTLTLQTDPGTILGTVGYMSPEQIRGQTIDARSDMFSLGCVIYEMITGSGPFERPTAADTLAAALKDEPDFSCLPAEIPSELHRIVAHGLEPDPDRRFQSARDLAFALEGIDLT